MFKNLSMFLFSASVATDLGRLEEVLQEHPLRPCGAMEMYTTGFVTPTMQDGDAMTRLVAGNRLFTFTTDEKILPAAVINDALDKRVKKIASEEGRRVGGRERKRLKTEILDQLLPRAFTHLSRTDAVVDLAKGRLLINTASRKAAERVVSGLRTALGSFPAIPVAPGNSPRAILTNWIAGDGLPPGLTLGDECELRDPATKNGARWKGRATDLQGDEVREHLKAGMQVYQLGLSFDDRIGFVLGEDLVVRKLKFFDVVLDELGQVPPESMQDEMDARYTLMVGELDRFLDRLSEWFDLHRPADA